MNLVIVVLLSCALWGAVALAGSPSVKLVQTSKAGDRMKSYVGPSWQADFGSQNTITVDSTRKYQKILGFGGAFTEAAAVNFAKMPAKQQAQMIELYWGATGIGYTVGRVPMNSCDFSVASYSFDDRPGDAKLAFFDWNVTHDQQAMIPLIKRAVAASRRPLKIYTSPWSPPAWMKINGQMTSSTRPGLKGIPGGNATEDYRATWAQYMSNFIAAYKRAGVPMWGATVQNEPLFPASWEACCYTGQQQGDFVRDFLGPTLRRDHPGLKLMVYDHNKDHVFDFVQPILSDPRTAAFVDGVAIHWYSGNQFGNVHKTHAAFPDKFILATEACNCPPSPDNFKYGETYSYDILGDLSNWAVGWTDWNLLLDMQGGPNHLQGFCNAPMLTDGQRLLVQPTFYFMGQISSFVAPGSMRLRTSVALGAPPAQSSPSDDNPTLQQCNGATYQQWRYDTINQQLRSLKGNRCMTTQREDDTAIAVTRCTDAPKSPIVNGRITIGARCLGVDMKTNGLELRLQPCNNTTAQHFSYRAKRQAVQAAYNGRCLSIGGQPLISASFATPIGTTVVVVQNIGDAAVTFKLSDATRRAALNLTIPAHSIQTYLY